MMVISGQIYWQKIAHHHTKQKVKQLIKYRIYSEKYLDRQTNAQTKLFQYILPTSISPQNNNNNKQTNLLWW